MRLCLSVVTALFLLTASAHAQADLRDNGEMALTVTKAPWVLLLAGKNLRVEQQQISPEGDRAYFLFIDKTTGLNVSAFIEPVTKCKTTTECRDLVRDGGNPAWENPIDKVSGELGKASYFEFLMPAFRGQKIDQQHLYAEFVENGYWVDLHLSKVAYKKPDHGVFEDLVKSVKFAPKEKTP